MAKQRTQEVNARALMKQPNRAKTIEIRTKDVRPNKMPKRAQEPKTHWLFPVGVSMLAMVILFSVGQYVWSWGSVVMDDVRYGRPRTFHADAFVGHEGNSKMPSHFVATNLKGRIHVIQIPGGDASKSRIFLGPQLEGENADLLPPKLSFEDVNRDKLLDMVIQVGTIQMTYINEKGNFSQIK